MGHSEPQFVLIASSGMNIGISIPPVLGTPEEDALAGVPAVPQPPATLARNARPWDQIASLARYMAQTEVHTYAFSVAANAILSLFPFIVMMFTIARLVFHSPAMESAIGDMIRYFLPTGQQFVTKNMEIVAHARKGVQLASVLMLLISSTGIFLPLEVALNRVWGVTRNRSYIMNQLVSLGLAAGIGTLAMISVAVTAAQQSVLQFVFFGHTDNFVFSFVSHWLLQISAAVASVLLFFLVYWILPNRGYPSAQCCRPRS